MSIPLAANRTSGELTYHDSSYYRHLQELKEIAVSLLPAYHLHWQRHSLVTMNVGAISRILYYNELYQKIVNVPGVICEFGVQWGATLAILTNLRSIHEPFNVSRTIFGFDTFQGFVDVDREKDGDMAVVGDFHTLANYEQTLEKILALQESFAPVADVRKFELVKGDACVTIDSWLEENPHAIVSMAIFDMDLYKPTKEVLEKIVPRLTKGSLLVFDELNAKFFPGETTALDDVVGLNKVRLRRTPLQTFCSWAVWGE